MGVNDNPVSFAKSSAGDDIGSFSSCPAVAMLRLSLAVTEAVPVVAGLPAVTEDPVGGADVGFFSSAKAGAEMAAVISAANRTRCMDMDENPWLCRALALHFWARAFAAVVSQFR